VQELVAKHFPRPDAPQSIRRLPRVRLATTYAATDIAEQIDAAASADAAARPDAAGANTAAGAFIVGALNSEADHAIRDVLARGAATGNAHDIVSQAMGVGVAKSGSDNQLRQRSGGASGVSGTAAAIATLSVNVVTSRSACKWPWRSGETGRDLASWLPAVNHAR
jgi:hypothetical protein